MPVKDYALRLLSSSSTERYKEFPASPKGKKEGSVILLPTKFKNS